MACYGIHSREYSRPRDLCMAKHHMLWHNIGWYDIHRTIPWHVWHVSDGINLRHTGRPISEVLLALVYISSYYKMGRSPIFYYKMGTSVNITTWAVVWTLSARCGSLGRDREETLITRRPISPVITSKKSNTRKCPIQTQCGYSLYHIYA